MLDKENVIIYFILHTVGQNLRKKYRENFDLITGFQINYYHSYILCNSSGIKNKILTKTHFNMISECLKQNKLSQ